MAIRFSKQFTIGQNSKSNSANFNAEMDNIYNGLNTLDADKSDLAGAGRTTETVKKNADDIAAHKANTANPHAVTATQVGAYSKSEADTAFATKANTYDRATTDAKINQATATATVAAGAAFPANPNNGQQFYRTDLKREYIYDQASASWYTADNYASDMFQSSFIASGLAATKDAVTASKLNVAAGSLYMMQANGTLLRYAPAATSFTTTVASATYYLDFNPDGTWSCGTAHSAQAGYLNVATVTTDATANISVVSPNANASAISMLPSVYVSLSKQQALVTPALVNGWVNYGVSPNPDVGYYKDSIGNVHIHGMIKSGTATNGTLLFVLLAGYRPLKSERYPVMYNNGSGPSVGYISVEPDGSVKISGTDLTTPAWLNLGIPSFRAEQ